MEVTEENELIENSTQSSSFIRYFNSHTARVIAFILVIFFILLHGFMHIQYGNNSCEWLLSYGHIQDDYWQPHGCMLHNYTQTEAKRCMKTYAYWKKSNYIVFMGDSRIRQQYISFVNHVRPRRIVDLKRHANMYFRDRRLNMRVHFIWMPFVDSRMSQIYTSWLTKDHPNFLITGSALWTIKNYNASTESYVQYSNNLTELSVLMLKLSNRSSILWMLQDAVKEKILIPVRRMITNKLVTKYNEVAIDLFDKSKVKLWRSSGMIADYFLDESEDGIHQPQATLNLDSQILFNYYCNVQMNFHNGSCCNELEKITILQVITAFIFISLIFLFISMICCQYTVFKHLHYYKLISPSSTSTIGFYPFLKAISQLAIIMFYFFLSDRTYYFMQESKYYTRLNFMLPFVYILILGIFFSDQAKDDTVLNREQTTEMKGWMQTLILIYQLTGASEMLAFYIQIRIIITTYLFISLFGHFSYFWKTGDFSLYRICKVLFRLNFLVITLCFVMNRPYQFYYYIPYASLSFILLYVVMAVYPKVTLANYEKSSMIIFYFFIKLVTLALILSLIYKYEIIFETIFLSFPFKALFVTSDDSISTWRRNMFSDLYIVIYASVFSMLYVLLKNNISDRLSRRCITVCTVLLVLVCSVIYYVMIANVKDASQYDNMHMYVSVLPVLVYVSLRNLIPCLKIRYSNLFSWIGQISLELCVTQCHIWLSADTHGVLVLIPGDSKILNSVTTTLVFICTAHQLHSITEVLNDFLIPRDNRLLVRNFLAFTVFLLPIAISNGLIL